jgi:carbamoyl-phosphate synthase large subunit
MNVLISSSGRRTSLYQLFAKAVEKYKGEVYCCDADPLAPTLIINSIRSIVVPRLSDPTFKSKIFDYIISKKIQLIVPTIDTELNFYAENKKELNALGCSVLISESQFVEVCNDKWKTYQLFKNKGVDVPSSWLPASLDMSFSKEFFIKPRNGSASVGAKISSVDEIGYDISNLEKPIVQEVLKGDELTVDCLVSFDGKPIYFVPRYRLRTLAGESIQSKTLVADEKLSSVIMNVLNICGDLGAVGPLTLQFFKTEIRISLIEINPRFGGGYPLSYRAGAHYPEWIIENLLEGTELELDPYIENLVMSRYYKESYINVEV